MADGEESDRLAHHLRNARKADCADGFGVACDHKIGNKERAFTVKSR
jgi:hypothetical protein